MNLHKVYSGIIGVIVVGLGFAAFQWINERESRIKAEAESKAQEKVITLKDQAIAVHDQQWQQQQLDFQRQISDIRTLSQANRVLQPLLLPSQPGAAALPVPQQVTKTDLPAAVQKDLPGAPTDKFSLLSDPQMIDLAKREKSCEGTEAGLTHCNLDLVDWQVKFAASQKEVQDWKTAAKGGNWMHRTLKIAVPLGCAGAGAWLGSKASKDSKGAAIGALAGGGTCALSFHF